MKKILFVSPHMIAGGVEKALINLTKELVERGNDITIMLINASGAFLEQIDSRVRIKQFPTDAQQAEALTCGGGKAAMAYYLKKAKVIKAARIGLNKLRKKICPEFLGDWNRLSFEEEYDIAVCFHIHMPFIVRLVAEKINAKKKYAWVHNDFETSGYNVKAIEGYLTAYNNIFTVSSKLKDELLQRVPLLKEKTTIAKNLTDEERILEQSRDKADWNDDFQGIRLLTVGRLNHQKGYDLAINVMKRLVMSNRNIKWYIIGQGELQDKLKKQVKSLSLENSFVFLGIKSNPYPYFKECDIYVQPSRHEGFVTTITEAKLFFKPIVVTSFAGSFEQITNGRTGTIIDFSEEQVFDAIKTLIDDQELRALYTTNLKAEAAEKTRCEYLDYFN